MYSVRLQLDLPEEFLSSRVPQDSYRFANFYLHVAKDWLYRRRLAEARTELSLLVRCLEAARTDPNRVTRKQDFQRTFA